MGNVMLTLLLFQSLSSDGSIVVKQLPSAWEHADEDVNYKKYWDIDESLISLLDISPEEESVLRLHKLIEFTTKVGLRVSVPLIYILTVMRSS